MSKEGGTSFRPEIDSARVLLARGMRRKEKLPAGSLEILERTTGFEPATLTLAR
jgi:hypothetical protein